VDEQMTQRVMAELRAEYTHDDEELLRALATRTVLGAAVAWRLSVQDLGRAIAAELTPALDWLLRRL
jgi:hypothetical protein